MCSARPSILRAAAGLLSIKAVGAVSLAILIAAWCLYVLATDSPK